MCMKIFPVALVATLVFSLAGSPCFAAEQKRNPKPAGSVKTPEQKTETRAPASQPEVTAKNPLDLNFATKQQLMALPGVDEGHALKIIEGRPYKVKAQLRQKNIIPAEVFYAILDKITIDIAKYERQEKAVLLEKEQKLKQKQEADKKPKKKVEKEKVK